MNYLSPREIIKNEKEVLSTVTWSSNATRNQNVDNLSRINLNFPANNFRFFFFMKTSETLLEEEGCITFAESSRHNSSNTFICIPKYMAI